MANYANAKATIAANIYTNHTGQVTAEMVKAAANSIVDTLIAGGYLYAGVAKLTPTQTNPGSPDANVFYIATEPGTYTNFGSLVVADGEVAIFKYNGTWSKEVTGAATAAQVTELGQQVIYDVTKNNPTAGPNNDGKFESLSALLSDANLSTLIPVAVRCGGMSIRFIQTDDNKYYQFRLTNNTWSTNPSDWHLCDCSPIFLFNGGNSGGVFTPADGKRVRTDLLIGKCTIATNPPYEIFKISIFSKVDGHWIEDIRKAGTADKYGMTYTNNDNFYVILFYNPDGGSGYPISNQDNIIKSFVLESNTGVEIVKLSGKALNAFPLCNGGVDVGGGITTTNLRVRTELLTGSLSLSVNSPYIVWKIALYDKITGDFIRDVNYYDKAEKNNITYEDYEHYYIITFANTVNSLPISVKDPIINNLTIDRNILLELCKSQGAFGLSDDIEEGLTTAVSKQNGNSIIINFITDTHFDEFYGAYNMKKYMQAVFSGVPTLNIHGGDILSLMDKASVDSVISGIVAGLPVSKSKKPVIFVNGNHDSGYNETVYVSATQFKALYNANIQKANYPADDVNYFYIDFEVNKLRVFVLDSFNREAGATHTVSAYGTAQLTWLYDTLASMQNGWKVIIFTHTLNAETRAFELVKAFANKGTTVGDYTFPSGLDVDLIGVIQGHLHQDYFSNSDGFNHIAVTRGWDASNQKYVAFSLFTINLDDGEMFETRIGSGSDRTYTFNP